MKGDMRLGMLVLFRMAVQGHTDVDGDDKIDSTEVILLLMLLVALYEAGCVVYVYMKGDCWSWTAVTHTVAAVFLPPVLIASGFAVHLGRKTQFMCDMTYRSFMIVYLLCTAAIYAFYYSKQLLV